MLLNEGMGLIILAVPLYKLDPVLKQLHDIGSVNKKWEMRCTALE